MKTRHFLLPAMLCVVLLEHVRAYDVTEELALNRETFPADFKSGLLGAGVDCEHIRFEANGQFAYKFTGDCKGWGRILKGKWSKQDDKLVLVATLREDASEGKKGCAGSYYHVNTAAESKACFDKFRKKILAEFGIFPAIFEISGEVRLTEKLTVSVSLKSVLTNNAKKGRIKGLMNFEDNDFGKLYVLK
jgi:hypothetical protein